MKPGPAISTEVTVGQRLELRRDQRGKRARIGPRRLGQHHRRIGREVAVRRVARRLDRDRAAVEAGRQRASATARRALRRGARHIGRKGSIFIPFRESERL